YLSYQIRRFETPLDGGTKKEFLAYRPHPDSPDPDAPNWIPGIRGVPRVLYRLDELAGVERVLFVEGEKDVDLLKSLGIPATTVAFGAKGWRQHAQEYIAQLEALGSPEVVVCADHDIPGHKFMAEVATDLRRCGITVRRVRLPGLGPVQKK